jgi:hypothetical protein
VQGLLGEVFNENTHFGRSHGKDQLSFGSVPFKEDDLRTNSIFSTNAPMNNTLASTNLPIGSSGIPEYY